MTTDVLTCQHVKDAPMRRVLREIAEMMSDDEIALAQRDARAWIRARPEARVQASSSRRITRDHRECHAIPR